MIEAIPCGSRTCTNTLDPQGKRVKYCSERCKERENNARYYDRNRRVVQTKKREHFARKAAEWPFGCRRTALACGMTKDEAWALLREQGYRCAATGRPFHPGDRVHLDHDHKTMVVRGFILANLNVAIGLANENPETLRALADYLEARSDRPRLVESTAAA